MGNDPLLSGHITWIVVLIVLIKVIVAFIALMISVLLAIWIERKVISDMQNRIGPNRAGPFGLLQSLADGIKLFFKEDLIPERSDKFIFKLAPYLSVIPAFITFTLVPVGGIVHIFGHTTELQVADPPIGILLLLAMSSISVYGVMLAGWSSGSKYPLIGSVRASAQMISYEAAMGLSIASVVLLTGSLSTRDMVTQQLGTFLGFIPHWNIIRLGVIPFIVFIIAITAEVNRPPFDLVEAEQELVGGFHTEYSSIRFALFYLAEYMNTITMSAIMVTMFFGGPDGPDPQFLHWLWPIAWFIVKTAIFFFIYVWFRAALPRLRYDQLMDLGWKVLIPVMLVWLLVVAAMRVSRPLGFAMVGLGIIGGLLLYRAIAVGRDRSTARELARPSRAEIEPPQDRREDHGDS
ncbi:NADH-quinone oxidoreductase subunit NuoH [Ferrimicrobium acidiphilum]|jgi:NADH-quinone oxidoreductase subunit H|uniref:NADH-quinone oxidoreductase subunit H n=1 Tax=Ferrimicrobium acidiphilum DSM 19497 TaxID=1121877 RepID=A0A0D8FWK4_9ACTN|nr:NADH-quinone oxidoreductase subunit NuoH [Ferrimicrobium acidiphilum]KJE77678.1 NADH-quinone oxidoreductase subunit 8 [Ferrimicrobium acidiphilum DSM 19497]